MKKLLSLLLSIMLLTSILTGCGKKTESQGSDLLTDSTAQGEAMSHSENEALSQTKEGLQITLNGENEATITLNDEAIGELDSTTQGDEGQLVNEINIYLTSGDWEHCVNLNITDKHFNIYAESPDAQEPLWNHSDDDMDANRTDKSFSVTINQVGIASVIKQCSEYKIEFNTFEPWECKVLAEGSISDILSEGENQQLLQAMFPDDETIKLKIYGEEAKAAFYNYENIRINIYESEEQINADNPCPSLEFKIGQESNGYRLVTASSRISQESNSLQDLAEGYSTDAGLAAGAEYGVAIKYTYENISELVMPEYVYELYFGNNKVETGIIADILSEEKAGENSGIADITPVHEKDSEFFVPDTNEYSVTVIEMPNILMFEPVWYQKMDTMIYGATSNNSKEIMITVAILDSYDEFGLRSSKYKIIYPSTEAAMYSAAGDEMIVEEMRDDNLITAKLFEDCDVAFFGSDDSYIYNGHYDNVRYFELSRDSVSERSRGEFWGIRMTNADEVTPKFALDDLTYEMNQSSTSQVTDDLERTFEVTTYSTRNTEMQDFDEIHNLYSNTPDSWQEHPYGALVPTVPQGVRFEYIEDTVIDENNLCISTYETGGCTKEQATEMINELRNMEYEELICDSEDEESINVCVKLQGDYFVRVIFDKSSSETQNVRVFINSD